MKRPTCVEFFDARFGRILVKYFGGDPSPIQDDWCWPEFAEAYPHLREKAEKYFETTRTGDPAQAACSMVDDCGSSREWAEGVIERAKTGNPAWAAYYMARYCGSSREWAEGVIEKAKIGDPAWAARYMFCYCGSSQEWYEEIKRKHSE